MLDHDRQSYASFFHVTTGWARIGQVGLFMSV